VKKLLFAAVAVVGLVAGLSLLSDAHGQGQETAGRASKGAPPAARIAVIDLGHVYRNYRKFEDLRKDVKEALEAAEARAKGYVDQAQAIQKELKAGQFDETSPEYLEREKKVIQLSSRFEAYKTLARKDLAQRDARVYLDIYNDIANVVKLVAEQNGYTLVVQVNREAASAEDPKAIGQTLGNSVIFHRAQEDITESVLAYLNRKYESSAASAGTNAPSKPATRRTAEGAKARKSAN
jgi:outer membrane protein